MSRLTLLLAVAGFGFQARGLPAFPGAEGWGTETAGGRGGAVLKVTTLADSGAGSLRAAVDASGCRIVIFEVGGTITLQSPLLIDEGCITIAGQTGLGQGVELRNQDTATAAQDSFVSIHIEASDVVIRHLKVRSGIPNDEACNSTLPPEWPGCYDYCSFNNPAPDCVNNFALHPTLCGTGQRCKSTSDIDPIHIGQSAERVVLDHVSVGWGTDEQVSVIGATDVTISRTLIAEGIDFNRYTTDLAGGKGMMFGNSATGIGGHSEQDTTRVTVHHSLFASNGIRNPQANSYCVVEPTTAAQKDACASDFRSNVVYNWTTMGMMATSSEGHHLSNMVGNYFKAGPQTHSKQADTALSNRDWGDYLLSHHVADNFLDASPAPVALPILCLTDLVPGEGWNVCPTPEDYNPAQPYGTPPVTTTPGLQAYDEVRNDVGANTVRDAAGVFSTFQDANDARVLADVQAGTGDIIDSDQDVDDVVYAWPGLSTYTGAVPADGDADGIPDGFDDTAHCLDGGVADDAEDFDGDGYTNLEEYLNGTLTGDLDGDGIANLVDTCPALSNPFHQQDLDGDGIGNLCDCDFDNDGLCGDPQDWWVWWFCKNYFVGNETYCAIADLTSDGVMNNWDVFFYNIAAADGLPGPGTCQ